MKKKTTFILLSGIVLCLLTFFACKKQEQPIKVDETPVIKTAVDNIKQKFSTIANLENIKQVKSLMENLDYDVSTRISLGDSGSLFIVRIKANIDPKVEKFLAISFLHSEYEIDGIYTAKDLSTISDLFKTNHLSPNDSIVVRAINGDPKKEWVTNNKGKIKYRIARRTSKKDLATNPTLRVTTNSVGGQNCDDYYWWEYDSETGLWIPIVFLYRRCDAPDDPNDTGSSDEACIDDYNQQLDNFDNEANGATGTDYSGSGISTSIVGDPITKNWSDNWICLNGYGGWSLKSFETGQLRKASSPPDPSHTWVWKSLSHQGILMNGTPFKGTTVTYTQGFATASFTEGNAAIYDYYSGGIEINFSCTYTLTPIGNCPVIKDVIDALPYTVLTKIYVAHAFWTL